MQKIKSNSCRDHLHEEAIEYFSKRMMAKECRDHPWLAKKYIVSVQQQIERTSTIQKPQASIHRVPRVQANSMDELDMTKDNLKLFVERWREHPDSPYLIDLPQCITLPHQCSTPRDHEELVSLRGHSPSPCASISSTLSEVTENNSPRESYGSFLTVPPTFNFGFERRASEGVSTEKLRSDPASQIVLAEEIIKLSERLRSIAMGACVNEVESPAEGDKVNKMMKEKVEDRDKRNGSTARSNGLIGGENAVECNEIAEKLSSITRHRRLNGTTFHSNRNFEKYTEANSGGNVFAPLKKKKQRKEEGRGEEGGKVRRESLGEQVEELANERVSGGKEGEMDLTPPWRRPRVKQFGETSRDVPRISGLRNLHKSLNLDEPTSTKDLLLHLLGEWEEVSMRPSGGRKSVSVDWCGEESVARKTMNSLAEYFQSKQQKSTTANANSPTSSSIHRWDTSLRYIVELDYVMFGFVCHFFSLFFFTRKEGDFDYCENFSGQCEKWRNGGRRWNFIIMLFWLLVDATLLPVWVEWTEFVASVCALMFTRIHLCRIWVNAWVPDCSCYKVYYVRFGKKEKKKRSIIKIFQWSILCIDSLFVFQRKKKNFLLFWHSIR